MESGPSVMQLVDRVYCSYPDVVIRLYLTRDSRTESVKRHVRRQASPAHFALQVGGILLVIIFFFSHDALFCVSFAAEVLRAYGVLLLLQRVVAVRRSDARRDLGLSIGTQQLHAVVFVTRLFFKIYEWDFLYAAVEVIALASTIYIVLFLHRADGDSESRLWLIPVVCLLLAVPMHPAIGSRIINITWAFSTYVECVALLPQILMLRSRANAIETSDHRAQYVACLFFSRLLEGSYWVMALWFRSYVDQASKACAIYVIVTELIHSMLLIDFIKIYVRCWRNNQKMVLPAISQ